MVMRPSVWTALLLPVLFLADSLALLQPAANCLTSCHGVDIPFPFGIGAGCFMPGFEIECIDGMPKLANNDVLSLTLSPRPEARVKLPIAFQCYNATNGTAEESFGGNASFGSVYRISSTRNELVALGCNTFVYTNSLYSGCIAYCDNNAGSRTRRTTDDACSGFGCCRVDILPGLTDNGMTFLGTSSNFSRTTAAGMAFSPCDYAFIVEKNMYDFRELNMIRSSTTMPLVLDWAIPSSNVSSSGDNMTCAEEASKPGYACASDNSECLTSPSVPGYICSCTEGYGGNPYIMNGCADINECENPSMYPCQGVCRNLPGSYACECPGGKVGNARTSSCVSKFRIIAKNIAIGGGGILGVIALIFALRLAFIRYKKRKMEKLFEKNGGGMLKNMKGLTIFTKDGLRQITKDNGEFIGKGSFGNVYKGTLPDKTVVAVKTYIKVDEATKVEFVEEVEIQTQMIHKNILKLVGCCLEVDVPVLVYEFAANGTLEDILHNKRNQVLSLDSRLDIAIGSAEGLKYMHSNASQSIRHGDVKPDNILLDENLTPKISDFGLSKLLKEEYVVKVVVGCMGYIDPAFMKTGLLTQKSDVYSFGAVLLEIITGKRNLYDHNCSLILEYRKVYENERSGRAMFDIDIATEEDIPILEEMGKLAMDCLKEDLEARPDMTEVAEHLVMIRRNKKFGKSNSANPNNTEDITIHISPSNTEVTRTTSANTSSKITPYDMDILPSP